jgi:L-fucose isomerase-like protein
MFAPVGTTFTGHHAKTRKAPLTFQAATQDAGWLADGVRMLATIGKMKRARVCVLGGTKSEETQIPGLGVTLRRLPLGQWMEEFRKASTTAEVRAIADFYTKAAKKIIEPKPAGILDAAKFYVVARKIMAEENCQGISVDCMRVVGQPGVPCGPCLAWSKLNDELLVGACEADVDAISSLLLAHSLLRRPGFVQDPVPNTINRTLIGAHCSCPTKLAGLDKPPAPLVLRSDNGTNYGCATQVLWPVGESATVMKFIGPKQIVLGTGKVVSNIDTTVSGGCRTSVELQLDQGGDPRDYRGFHQLFLLGKWDRMIQAYGQLAGIDVVPI